MTNGMTKQIGRPAVLVAGDFSISSPQRPLVFPVNRMREVYRNTRNFAYLNVVGKVLDKMVVRGFEDLLPSRLFKQSRFVSQMTRHSGITIAQFMEMSFDREHFSGYLTDSGYLDKMEAEMLRQQVVDLICRLQHVRASYLALGQLAKESTELQIVMMDLTVVAHDRSQLTGRLKHILNANRRTVPSLSFDALLWLTPFDASAEHTTLTALLDVAEEHKVAMYYNTVDLTRIADLVSDRFFPVASLLSYENKTTYTDIGLAHYLFLTDIKKQPHAFYDISSPVLKDCGISLSPGSAESRCCLGKGSLLQVAGYAPWRWKVAS